MTFESRDAFPARGGVGDERRFDPTACANLAQTRARYVELHAHSAYSFLDGASLPEELAARAAELGYDALALTDPNAHAQALALAGAHLFDPSGKGRPFKEWVVVPPTHAAQWPQFAESAVA